MRIAVVAVIGLSLAGAPARAWQVQPDPRWLPFIGCWEREPPMAMKPAVRLTCVLPTENPAAVDFVTVADGRAVASERILVAAGDQAMEREGCSGSERTSFARREGLIYRSFEAHCQAGIARTASQLLSLVPDGGWIDVQVMSVLGEHAQRVFRYTESIDPDLAPDIAQRLDGLIGAAREARAAADDPVRVPDVIEASRQVGTDAVQAWLASGPEMLPVDRRNLLAAQRAGLPDAVLDMMVAMSYPERFQISDSGSAALEGPGGLSDGVVSYAVSGVGGGSPLLYDDGLSECTSYTERLYPMSEYNCRRYGYDPFSLGGYGYWSWGVRTLFIPSRGGGFGGGGESVAAAPHGRVVNGSGYSAGTGAVSSREAHPQSGSTGSTSFSGGSSSGGSSTGASSSGAGGVTASSTGNTGNERTAKPRP